jgi:hypothetical protein
VRELTEAGLTPVRTFATWPEGSRLAITPLWGDDVAFGGFALFKKPERGACPVGKSV